MPPSIQEGIIIWRSCSSKSGDDGCTKKKGGAKGTWMLGNLDQWADPGVVNDPIPGPPNLLDDDAPTYHLADEPDSMFVGDALWVRSVFESASEVPRDLEPNIVIDSGASATVYSIAYIESRFPNFRQELPPSARSFKFGGSRRFGRKGELILSGYLRVRPLGGNAPTTDGKAESNHIIHILVDLIDSRIPFLLSNQTLNRMKASLDFEHHVLEIPTIGLVNLNCTGSGISLYPFSRRNSPARKKQMHRLRCSWPNLTILGW